MKKLFALALCALLLWVPKTAAAGSYENAGALYEAWVTQGCVPDYITAVLSTDGGTDNLTFGLVAGEEGERGRQEILDLVRDDSTVTIMYQTYSRNELYRIQEEVCDAYFGQDLGLVTAGVSETENRLCFEVKSEFADNAGTQEMIRLVTERYGDAVRFRFTDNEIRFVVDTETVIVGPAPILTAPPKPQMPPVFPFVLCAVAAALLGIELRRRHLLAVTAEGAAVGTQQPGIRDLEAAIRRTEPKPSAALDDRVMRSIERITEK